MQQCPYCKAEIQNTDDRCRFCGNWLNESAKMNRRVVPAQPVEVKPLTLDEFMPDRLEKQDYKLGLIISTLLIPLIIASIIVLLTVSDTNLLENTGYLLFVLISLSATMGLAIFQMMLLIRYLNNFYFMETAQLAIKGVISAVILLFICTLYIAFTETDSTAFIYIPIIIMFVSQLIVGWQLARSKDSDFVGGLSSLGVVIFISAFIFPVSFLIPVMACNIFNNAKNYAEKYGFKGDE